MALEVLIFVGLAIFEAHFGRFGVAAACGGEAKDFLWRKKTRWEKKQGWEVSQIFFGNFNLIFVWLWEEMKHTGFIFSRHIIFVGLAFFCWFGYF